MESIPICKPDNEISSDSESEDEGDETRHRVGYFKVLDSSIQTGLVIRLQLLQGVGQFNQKTIHKRYYVTEYYNAYYAFNLFYVYQKPLFKNCLKSNCI